MTKIAGSGSESGSISQKHGSEDPDQDPPQNVMDPEHWFEVTLNLLMRDKGYIEAKCIFNVDLSNSVYINKKNGKYKYDIT